VSSHDDDLEQWRLARMTDPIDSFPGWPWTEPIGRIESISETADGLEATIVPIGDDFAPSLLEAINGLPPDTRRNRVRYWLAYELQRLADWIQP
jgi:hypothetical protein